MPAPSRAVQSYDDPIRFVVPRLVFRAALLSKGFDPVAHVAADQFAFAYCAAMSIVGNATGTCVPIVCA